MDREKQEKLRNLKVIFSEIIMVLAVVVLVVVLGFIVSGYWLNSDFKVERQGMLQVSSTPSGADVDIDGKSSWLQRTNTSKILSSGEHTITLTKEGYDSWSKTINITEGLLYRLNYPRLFLQNRKTETILSSPNTVTASFSPDYGTMLLTNGTTKWYTLDLKSEKPVAKPIDISDYFSSTSLAEDADKGLFEGEIISLEWDQNGDHVIIRSKYEDTTEWVILDINNIENSFNLSKEFNMSFDSIKALDKSSSALIAIDEKGSLRKIDLSKKQLSSSLINEIYDYDNYGNDIVYSAKFRSEDFADSDEDILKALGDSEYYIGILKDDKPTFIKGMDTSTLVLAGKFYDEEFILVLEDNALVRLKYDNFEEVSKYEISFVPEKLKLGFGGEFATASSSNQLATLDFEANSIKEWSIENDNYGWIDAYMLYTVSDGELVVYDFDGQNRRIINKNVSAHYPAGITENKYLYYFRDGSLVRDLLTP